MKNILIEIIIAALVIIICFVISIVNDVSFFWLLLPIIVIILLAILSKLLTEKYGKSYGITTYLFLFFFVPLGWYLFSKEMPVTALSLKSQKKAEDFSSFQDYDGSVDAKKEFVTFQQKQDSILKEEVSKLLAENRTQEALELMQAHKDKNELLKSELLDQDVNTQYESVLVRRKMEFSISDLGRS